MRPYDVALVGGGIVGVATALALTRRRDLRLVVLEAEPRLAAHQTGNNSGVIHSGLYYKPGSLKARLCVTGREALYRFCAEQGVAHERCGKVVVATTPGQLPALDELERRGRANGLLGLERLDAEGITRHEPHVRGVAGLFVPETGIVDYTGVTEAMARLVQQAGGEVRTDTQVVAIQHHPGVIVVETTAGPFEARALVNCAGLQSDRVARLCGVDPGLRIVPFRGEYYELVPHMRHLVNNLVYPVPDPRFPFLGVHFTRMVNGGVEAGPNAVLAFARHGYTQWRLSPRDLWDYLSYTGFWRLGLKYARVGVGEFWRSFFKSAFVRALQGLVPEIGSDHVHPGGAGVRAQALLPDGGLADDFRIVEAERSFHVLNAPSPAATASLSIGEHIAERAARHFHLQPTAAN